MQQLKHILWQQRYFLSLYGLFFVAAGLAIAFCTKHGLHLFLSSHHTLVSDYVFRYYTHVCEWLPYIIGILLVFYRYWASLLLLLSQGITAVLIYFAKEFYHAHRPVRWFAENMPDVHLQLVEGVNMHTTYSFPSGHSAAFFAMFFALSFLLPRRSLQIIFCLLALLGCYSRVYLSQHFCLDLWVGSFIGIMSTLVLLLWRFPTRMTALDGRLALPFQKRTPKVR